MDILAGRARPSRRTATAVGAAVTRITFHGRGAPGRTRPTHTSLAVVVRARWVLFFLPVE